MRHGRPRPDSGGIVPRIPTSVTLAVWLLACSGLSQTWDRAAAESALNRARDLRQQLTIDPSAATRENTLKCIRSYKRVYLSDPHFHGSDDAIYEAAVLYQEMAARFRSADALAESIRLFKFLVSDYGVSPHRRDALSRLAILEPAAGNAPPGTSARTLRPQPVTPANAKVKGVLQKNRPARTLQTRRTATIRSIRHWSTRDHTRMVIDLDGRVSYSKEMIGNPDRLFFDLSDTVLTPEHVSKSIVVGDRVLKKIRVGQNKPDVARIVLDLEKGIDYSVSELENPFRIVVEVRQAGDRSALLAASSVSSSAVPAPASLPRHPAPAPERLKDQGARQAVVRAGLPKTAPPGPSAPSVHSVAQANGSGKGQERNGQQNAQPPVRVPSAAAFASPSNGSIKTPDPADALASAPKVTLVLEETPQANQHKVTLDIGDSRTPVASRPAAADRVANAGAPPRSVGLPPPPKMASPTSRGNMTMTRVLGLKVTRIVIDPGHGGSDTGTVGPKGLREKDLTLDVARELKRSLEERIGAIVVMTRDDDRFVSLEERTAIANRNRADLFISIHANSSTSRSTSGVETYYLHFARSWSERVVAARENAAAVQSVSELEDLIRKIVQADKSSESRELASILQRSLYSGTRKLFPSARNRGVRSAPFLVLVGAEMPAVLVEVAFLSNPRDERLLREEKGQQVVAQALLSGIEGYVKTLSNFVAEAHTGSK